MEKRIHILFGFDNPNFVSDLGKRLGSQGIVLFSEVSVSKEKILDTLRHPGPIKTAVLMKTLPSGDVFTAEELASIMDDNDVNIIIICHAEDKSSVYMQTLLNNGIVDAMFDGEADYDRVLELVLKRRSRREAREYYGLSNSTAAGIRGAQRPVSPVPQAPIQPRQPYRVQGATYDPSADWQDASYSQAVAQPSMMASAPMYGDDIPTDEPVAASGSMFMNNQTVGSAEGSSSMFGPVPLFEDEEEAFIEPGEDDVVAQEELTDEDDTDYAEIPLEEATVTEPKSIKGKAEKKPKPKKEKKEKKPKKEKKVAQPSSARRPQPNSGGSMFSGQPNVSAPAPVPSGNMFAPQQGVQPYTQYNGNNAPVNNANGRQYIPGNPMSPAGFNNMPQSRVYGAPVKKEPKKQSGSPFLVVLVILVIVMVVVTGIFGITLLNYKIQSQKANDAFREAKEEEELLSSSYSKSYEDMMEEAEMQSQDSSDVKVVEEEAPEPTYEDMNDITQPEAETAESDVVSESTETGDGEDAEGSESVTRDENPGEDTVLNRDGTQKNAEDTDNAGNTDSQQKKPEIGKIYGGKKVISFIKEGNGEYSLRDKAGNNMGFTPDSDVESMINMSGTYLFTEDFDSLFFIEQ